MGRPPPEKGLMSRPTKVGRRAASHGGGPTGWASDQSGLGRDKVKVPGRAWGRAAVARIKCPSYAARMSTHASCIARKMCAPPQSNGAGFAPAPCSAPSVLPTTLRCEFGPSPALHAFDADAVPAKDCRGAASARLPHCQRRVRPALLPLRLGGGQPPQLLPAEGRAASRGAEGAGPARRVAARRWRYRAPIPGSPRQQQRLHCRRRLRGRLQVWLNTLLERWCAATRPKRSRGRMARFVCATALS